MTKIRLRHLGWIYVTIVADWLTAVDMAVNNQFPSGVRDEVIKRGYELNLMAYNGLQSTSESFKKTCETLGINLAFTLTLQDLLI